MPGSVHWRGGPELKWLRVHAERSCPVDCTLEGENTLIVVPAAGASTAVVITTNGPTAPTGAGRLRVGDRVNVYAPEGVEVHDRVAEPIVIRVDG